MNTKHLSLAFAVAAALLAGCAKSPIEEVKTSEQFTNLELAYVGATETKAAIDGKTFPEDGEIGLFLFKDELAETPYGESGYTNVKYAYNSIKSKWTASPAIKVGSIPGHLFGYYPYDSEVANIKAIPVTSSLNGDDVMYASKQEQPITDLTAANTSIKMNHALARVAIKVINNGYTGDAKLSSIKFEDATIASSGTLNAIDGSISASKADDVALSVPATEQTIATGDGTTYECLLVPSEINNERQDVWLYLTIDGQEKNLKLSGGNGVIFKPGVKSTVTITLSNTGIALKSVSINDWQTVKVGEVKVGGHKVTIQTADGIDPNDILAKAYVEGNNVIIKASSFQSKRLICNVGGDAQCERVVTNDKFTFTISEISSDIEAVLGYDPIVTLTVSSDSYGKVWIGEDKSKTSGQFEVGQQVVIHAEPKDNFKFFKWNDNNKESDRTITVGVNDVTYSASFIHKDVIPSLFTVDSNGKQVFFSNGNLYCSGVKFNEDGSVKSMANAQWGFEANQYDTTPSSNGDRVGNHISHFMWCRTPEKAMALEYDSNWNGETPFFAAKNFTVNGYSGWGVLTGGTNGEWVYLLNIRNTIYGKDTDVKNRRYAAVKVNGMAGLLIFPDEFSSWPSEAGDEPKTFNKNSSNWNDRNYTVEQFTVLQNNGCVFLPAAGSRDGNGGDALVSNVGRNGYYWSASPIDVNYAYDLYFFSGDVNPSTSDARLRARSVRLVTESK
ncbi:MAG: fimbrillin family protein [Bacteroidaceae bacterium]|nr:fimbrillin family protein [Bacteroidaceae bacterium]